MFPFGPVPTSWTGWIVQFADKICALGEFASGVSDLIRLKIFKSKKEEDFASYLKEKYRKKKIAKP